MTHTNNLSEVAAAIAKSANLKDDSYALEAIQRAEADWVNDARQEVERLYAEELHAGEFAGKKKPALIALQSLKRIETDGNLKAILQLSTLYRAYTEGLFSHAGYETMIEWLNDGGIKVSGPTSDYLGLAQEIIPWCESHHVVVDGKPVNLNWFKRFVGVGGTKCIATRARNGMKIMREIITAENAEITQKIYNIQMILNIINNPNHTHEDLRSMLQNSYFDEPMEAHLVFNQECDHLATLTIEIATEGQLKALRKALKSITNINS